MAVIGILRNELPADGGADFLESHFDETQQVIRRGTANLPGHRMEQAKAVPQFLGRETDWQMNIVGGQPVNRKPVDDPESHRLILLFGKGAFDLLLKNDGAFHHGFHVLDGAECGLPHQV